MRKLKTIALVFVAATSALGGLAQFLDWLGIKSKDVRMIASMGWPHWIVLASGVSLFASSLGISFYALYINLYRVKSLERSYADEIASLKQSHAGEIQRLNTQHESEEFRSRQIRDEALSEVRTLKNEVQALKDAAERFRSEIDAKKPELLSLVNTRKRAAAQAALLSQAAACAKELERMLEELWHHWNNAGAKLVHPIGGTVDIKLLPANKMGDLIGERRDFGVLYWHHLARLGVDAPYFSSRLTESGYPSDKEYHVVLADLRDHTKLLTEAAERVWESGHPLEAHDG